MPIVQYYVLFFMFIIAPSLALAGLVVALAWVSVKTVREQRREAKAQGQQQVARAAHAGHEAELAQAQRAAAVAARERRVQLWQIAEEEKAAARRVKRAEARERKRQEREEQARLNAEARVAAEAAARAARKRAAQQAAAQRARQTFLELPENRYFLGEYSAPLLTRNCSGLLDNEDDEGDPDPDLLTVEEWEARNPPVLRAVQPE